MRADPGRLETELFVDLEILRLDAQAGTPGRAAERQRQAERSLNPVLGEHRGRLIRS
jgi:hypothetical protein